MPDFDMPRLHRYFIASLKKNPEIQVQDYPTKRQLKNLYRLKATKTSGYEKDLAAIKSIKITKEHVKTLETDGWLSTNIVECFILMYVLKISVLDSHEVCMFPSEYANQIFFECNPFDINGKLRMRKEIEKVSIHFFKHFLSKIK